MKAKNNVNGLKNKLKRTISTAGISLASFVFGGCETADFYTIGSASSGYNAQMSTSAQEAAGWTAIGNILGSQANHEHRMEEAKEGRSQVNVYVGGGENNHTQKIIQEEETIKDLIYTRDGRIYQGYILSQGKSGILFQLVNSKIYVPRDLIVKIEDN